MKRQFVFVVLLAFAASSVVLAADVPADHACMPYGKDFAFIVTPPEGWECACHAESTHGVAVALWPSNDKWPDAPALMYVAVSTKDGDSLDQLISHDLSKFTSRNPGGEVTIGEPIRAFDGTGLPVRLTSGLKSGRVEAIAYAEQPTVFLIFGLTAKSEAARSAAMSAFHQLIGSYVRIDEINFKDRPKVH